MKALEIQSSKSGEVIAACVIVSDTRCVPFLDLECLPESRLVRLEEYLSDPMFATMPTELFKTYFAVDDSIIVEREIKDGRIL